jgi:hypothetical protein
MPESGEGTVAGNTPTEAFCTGTLWSWEASSLTVGGSLSVATNLDPFIFLSSARTQELFQYLIIFSILLAEEIL